MFVLKIIICFMIAKNGKNFCFLMQQLTFVSLIYGLNFYLMNTNVTPNTKIVAVATAEGPVA